MKKLLVSLMALVAAGAWLGSAAGAQTPQVAGKFAVFGDIGYGWYAMKTLNDELDQINSSGVLSSNFSKINGGLNAGGGVSCNLLDFLVIGVEAQYLGANTKADLLAGGESKLNLPGMELGVFGRVQAPVTDMILVSGGVGVDYYWSWWHSEAGGLTNDFSGSQIGMKLVVGGEAFLIPDFMSVGLDLGYRFAKITELKDKDGNVLKRSTGENAESDYTGPYLLGLAKFYF